MRSGKSDLGLIPWHPSVKVLSVDESSGYIVVEKPCGILSQPNDKKSIKNAIIQAPYQEENESFQIPFLSEGRQEFFSVYLNNRLDSPTSGLVVLSFKEEAKDFLDKLFRENQVKKKYYAIVKGILPGKETIWEDRLETKKGSSLRTIRSQRGVSSKTMVKVIRTSRKLPIPVTLVEMQPLTGRTHQLRVQSALRNCPILGDKTYGDFKFNRLMEKVLRIDRLCLHARETVLPRKGQSPLSIFAKADFEALV